MSYADLAKHVQDISNKAYIEGYRDLVATRSPTLLAEQEPKLQQLCVVEVPEMYEPFMRIPDPASFDPMIESLQAALKKLCTGQDTRDPISTNGGPYIANVTLDKMGGSESSIEDWTGTAAMEFKNNFITPFPSIARNQFILVAALKSALEAERSMWEATRRDIAEIATETLKQLDSMDDCSAKEWTMSFTVVASVAGVGALAGGPLGVSIAVIGAAAWVVAAQGIEGPPESKVGGNDVNSVIASMRRLINKQIEHVHSTEERIARSVNSLIGTIDGKRDSFVSRRPALADATRRNITDPDQMGYSS